jgi:hypothetical protein
MTSVVFLFNSFYHLTFVLLVAEERTRIAWPPTLTRPASAPLLTPPQIRIHN